MTIQAVLFDLGGTLLEYSYEGQWREYAESRLAEMQPLVAKLLGPPGLGPEEFALVTEERIGRGEVMARQRAGLSQPFPDRLHAALASMGLEPDPAELRMLVEFFYEPIAQCHKPYPETRPVLEELAARGLPLAIITNSPWDEPPDLVQADLDRWNLSPFFATVVASGAVTWRKPNPAFMLEAARRLGLPPAACLVVGDSMTADIAGAQAAGMPAVWVNRTGRVPAAGEPVPSAEVASLAELPDVLASW